MRLLVLTLLALLSFRQAHACSVGVNSLYQKNLLVAYAAGEMDVDLAKATSIGIADYGHHFSGGSGGASCPTRIHTQARVTVAYRKDKFTQCSFSVTVKRSVQFGDEVVSGPYETVETELPTSGCSGVVPRPVKIPIIVRS